MVWNFFDSWVPKRHQKTALRCNTEDYEAQVLLCNGRYDDWQYCVKTKGLNDESCTTSLESYYICVSKQEAMKTFLEDSDLDK